MEVIVNRMATHEAFINIINVMNMWNKRELSIIRSSYAIWKTHPAYLL